MTDLNLNLDLGIKRITINNDPDKVIEFSPEDTLFIEKFYSVYSEILDKQNEYLERYEAMNQETDPNGVPVDIEAQIGLVKETTVYMRDKIDFLLGPGTSQTVFGEIYNLDVISQFLAGLATFVKSDRNKKLDKYIKPDKKGKAATNVME